MKPGDIVKNDGSQCAMTLWDPSNVGSPAGKLSVHVLALVVAVKLPNGTATYDWEVFVLTPDGMGWIASCWLVNA